MSNVNKAIYLSHSTMISLYASWKILRKVSVIEPEFDVSSYHSDEYWEKFYKYCEDEYGFKILNPKNDEDTLIEIINEEKYILAMLKI